MKRWARRLLVVAMVAGLLLGGRALGLGRYLSVDSMRALVEPWGDAGQAVFVAVVMAGILLHLPEAILIAIGAILFGELRGFALGWIAVVAGTTASFLVARYLARDWVRRTFAARFERFRQLDAHLESSGFRTVLLLRLVLFLAPPLNWAMGTTGVSLRSYVTGTAVGIIPGIAGTVYLAESVADAQSYRDLLTAGVLAPVAAVVTLFLMAVVLMRRQLAVRPVAG